MVGSDSTVRFRAPTFEGDSNEISKTVLIAISIQIKSLNRNLGGTNTGIFLKVFMAFA